MTAIDLSKQQELDADPKAIQLIKFTGNLDRPENRTMFFIIEEEKETILDFSQGIYYFTLIQCQYKNTQHNTSNIQFSNSQLNKSKSGIRNSTEVTLKFSSHAAGDSIHKNNFSQKFSLTNTQALRLCKAFAFNEKFT